MTTNSSDASRQPEEADRHSKFFFLRDALQQRLKGEGNNYSRLAEKINSAYHADLKKRGKEPEHSIDRRKLKAIVEDKQFVLNVWELEAFDVYLDAFGMGLSYRPILRRPSILETLTESRHVVFLIGAKRHDTGYDLSLWDFKAMAEIQRLVNNFTPFVRFDVEPIVLPESRRVDGEIEKLKDRTFFQEAGPSLVILGSPRANLAAELAIRMMAAPQMPPQKVKELEDAPFRFVWSRNTALRSCVAIEPEKLGRDHPKLARKAESQQWTLRIGDADHTASARRASPMTTYGVFLAQRRTRGQVWMVLSGLSGPATLGCAEIARRINRPLEGRPSSILWAPVMTESSRPEKGAVDQLDKYSLLHAPRTWPVPSG